MRCTVTPAWARVALAAPIGAVLPAILGVHARRRVDNGRRHALKRLARAVVDDHNGAEIAQGCAAGVFTEPISPSRAPHGALPMARCQSRPCASQMAATRAALAKAISFCGWPASGPPTSRARAESRAWAEVLD